MFSFFQNRYAIILCFLVIGFIIFLREDAKKEEAVSNVYPGNTAKFYMAEFTGEDTSGKEYMLKAKEAQNAESEQYLLNIVEMSYDFEGKGDLTLVSNQGVYDKNKQIFTGLGNVKINLQNQYFMFTEKLYANLSDRTLYTDQKVEVEGSGVLVCSTSGVNVNTIKKVIDYHGPIYSKFVES